MKKKGEVLQELKKKSRKTRITSWIFFGGSVILFLTGLTVQGYILLGLSFISLLYSIRLNRRIMKGDLKE